MKSIVGKILLVFVLGIGLLVGGLKVFEKQFIFVPSRYPEGNWNPPELGKRIYDVEFSSEDGTQLHGWWGPQEDEDRTILWLHGNGGNLSHRLDGVNMFHEEGFQIFIPDYRGYGKSEGSPSEDGIYKDGRAAYRFLREEKNVEAEDIFLLGRSLGSTVATKVAEEKTVGGVILVSAFTNAVDMSSQVLPIPFIGYLSGADLDSRGRIDRINAPLLMFHGDQDEVVPFELGKALFEEAEEPRKFVTLEGAGHTNIHLVAGERYVSEIKEFLDTYGKTGK